MANSDKQYVNTESNAIPFSVAPFGASIDMETRQKDPNNLTPEARKSLEQSQAKAQARKSEGFHTSPELERIEENLQQYQDLRDQTEKDLDAESHALASGNGSNKKVRELQGKIQEYESMIDALQRGARIERENLADQYQDKLKRAQAKLREQIDSATDDVSKALEKLDGDLQKVEQSFDQLEANLKELLPLTKSPIVGGNVSSKMKEVANLVRLRLGLEGNGVSNRDFNLVNIAPKARDFQHQAEIPEYLSDLPDPDAE